MAKQTVQTGCPNCGLVFQAEIGGLFGGNNAVCPKCGEKFDVKREGRRVVTCVNCQKQVAVDPSKGSEALCPACQKPLFNLVAKETIKTIPCPHCGRPNQVDIESTSAECVFCKKTFSPQYEYYKQGDAPSTIQPNFSDEYTIWRYCDANGNPVNRFNYASHLIVPEGMSALLLYNGKCRAPVGPGKYLLSDTRLSLNEQLEQAVTGADQTLTLDIYFVRNQFSEPAYWSDQDIPLTNDQGEVEGAVHLQGQTMLAVVDAKKLAEYAGYKTQTESALICVAPHGASSNVRTMVQSANLRGTAEAVQFLSARNGWQYSALTAHRYEIEQKAPSFINEKLAEVGLAVTQLTLTQLSYKEDEEYARRRRVHADVIRFTEQNMPWRSDVLSVHLKDKPALSAELVLKGTFWLSIIDQDAYFRYPQVKQWLETGVQETDVCRFCGLLVNELMRNVASNILQPLVDDTNADVRELHRYFHLLRRTMESYLNSRLSADGLQLKNFVMEQESFRPSPVLQQYTNLISHKSEAEIGAEMERFDRKMSVESDQNKLDTEVAQDSIEAQREKLRFEAEKRQTDFAVESKDRAYEAMRHEQELIRKEEKLRQQYARQDEEEELNWRERLDELVHRNRTQGRLRSAEEVRQAWEEKRQLEDAQLDAQIRRREKTQQAELRSGQTDMQARIQSEQAEAEHQRILGDIMRKIAESDLSLQEKLDSYERLCRNSRIDDENAHLVNAAQAKADAQFAISHTNLSLTREQQELLEEQQKNALDREERRKMAEFQRDMQRQQAEVAHEIEKLKLQYDQDVREANLEEKLYDQNAEIEKLRLILDHYTALDQNSANARVAASLAEATRAQVEKEYEARQAQAIREEQERRERLRSERDDKYNEQAERLLTRMWEIQSALGKMQIETDQKVAQAQIEEAHAEKGHSDMQDLIKTLEKMVSAVKVSANRPVSPAATPIQPAQSFAVNRPAGAGGYQSTASEYRICPSCGKKVSAHASTCMWCGAYLG